MSKKTVITDFTALKGKVSFSEESVSAAEAEPAVHNEGLKVGQSVVLMDSSLRGKIIRLGKTIRIELEDGLIIETSYGDFAVTRESEITSLKDARVKIKNTGSASKKHKPSAHSDGSLTVDLHIEALPGGRSVPKGHQLQFQMDIFRKTIRKNVCHKGMKITFIHGIGDGILKAAIRRELDEVLTLRCSYSVGNPAVTVVTIR